MKSRHVVRLANISLAIGFVLFLSMIGYLITSEFKTETKTVYGRERTSSATVITGLQDEMPTVIIRLDGPVNEPLPVIKFYDHQKFMEFRGRHTATVRWRECWKEIYRKGKLIKRIPLAPQLLSAY